AKSSDPRRARSRRVVRLYPGVLGTTTLAGVDHVRSGAQRDACEAARQDPAAALARDHVRTQIDAPRLQAPVGGDPGRAGRQLDAVLRDVLARVGDDARA